MQCPVEALTLLLRATLDDKVQVLMLCPLYPTMTVTIRLDALLYHLRSCVKPWLTSCSLPFLSCPSVVSFELYLRFSEWSKRWGTLTGGVTLQITTLPPLPPLCTGRYWEIPTDIIVWIWRTRWIGVWSVQSE